MLEPFFDSFLGAFEQSTDFIRCQIAASMVRLALQSAEKDSLVAGTELVGPVVQSRLRATTVVDSKIVELLEPHLASLEDKMRTTPPFPTTADHFILGVLRLCVKENYSGAVMSFANAKHLCSKGVGLTAKCEALFSLKRYDDVIACVIEAEAAPDGSSNSEDERKNIFEGFAAKAMLSLGLSRSSANVLDATDAVLQADEKMLVDIPLLRRALSYHKAFLATANNVYQFKSSQDFAELFLVTDRSDETTAMLRASKAAITENSETACALYHQAASLNPRLWVYPFLSSQTRNRTDPRALIDIDAAIRLDPDAKLLRAQRCMLYLEQQRAVDALKELHSLVLSDPSNSWMGLLRGRARALTGDEEGAVADFRRVAAAMEKMGESGAVARARGRLYCELATLIAKEAMLPEKQRLGLKDDMLSQAEGLLNNCIECDKRGHHFVAYKLRAELRNGRGDTAGATQDFLLYVRSLCERPRHAGLDLAALDSELHVCHRMLCNTNETEEAARVVALALVVLGDDEKLKRSWSEFSDTASPPKDQKLPQRPSFVPALHLTELSSASRRRRKTISEAPGTQAVSAKVSAEGTPVEGRRRKAKSGRLSMGTPIQKSVEDYGSVLVVPKPPPPPAVYDGELPSPPRLNAPPRDSSAAPPPTEREIQLMAQVEALQKELEAAKQEIERLKLLQKNEVVYF